MAFDRKVQILESEDIIEMNKIGKIRLLDHTDNMKPCTNYQKLKTDKDGNDYLISNGEKIIVDTFFATSIESQEELDFWKS